MEHRARKDDPLGALFLVDGADGTKPHATVNLLLRHGVRSCLEFQKTKDKKRAVAVSNPSRSPHVSFVDMGGNGYSTVRVTSDMFETDFVCIPRPIEPTDRPDSGPLRFRVRHRAGIWKIGERP
jgi:alkaline phosphatase D